MTPSSSEKPLLSLHPNVRDHVLALNSRRLRLMEDDFVMDEIRRRENLNSDEYLEQND